MQAPNERPLLEGDTVIVTVDDGFHYFAVGDLCATEKFYSRWEARFRRVSKDLRQEMLPHHFRLIETFEDIEPWDGREWCWNEAKQTCYVNDTLVG